MNHRNFTLLISLLLVIVFVPMLTGCGGKMRLGKHNNAAEKELVIPDFPTAKEQYAFAKLFQQGMIVSPELERRRGQMDELAQYYNRVLINFPQDMTYVPLTYLELGDCAAQSDHLDKAIQAYQHAQSLTPDEFVKVRAQYSIARVYDAQQRYVDAKVIYKKLIDEHKTTESGRVKDVLKRAYERYMMVQEKPASGRK